MENEINKQTKFFNKLQKTKISILHKLLTSQNNERITQKNIKISYHYNGRLKNTIHNRKEMDKLTKIFYIIDSKYQN